MNIDVREPPPIHFIIIINTELLNIITAQAQFSPRLRMYYDLWDSEEDQSLRMLNGESVQTYIQSNMIGFYNILEACRHHPVQHLVYASSSSVYGGNKKVPFSTDDRVDYPISLYAATKKSNELFAHCYSKLYNIPSTGLRFFTVYGPAGRPDMAYFGFTNKLLKG